MMRCIKANEFGIWKEFLQFVKQIPLATANIKNFGITF